MTPPVDIGDAHAVLAAVAAVASLVLTCSCCVEAWSDERWILALVALHIVALWTGTFGVVLRASVVARLLAAGALLCVGVSLFTGLMALILD